MKPSTVKIFYFWFTWRSWSQSSLLSSPSCQVDPLKIDAFSMSVLVIGQSHWDHTGTYCHNILVHAHMHEWGVFLWTHDHQPSRFTASIQWTFEVPVEMVINICVYKFLKFVTLRPTSRTGLLMYQFAICLGLEPHCIII